MAKKEDEILRKQKLLNQYLKLNQINQQQVFWLSLAFAKLLNRKNLIIRNGDLVSKRVITYIISLTEINKYYWQKKQHLLKKFFPEPLTYTQLKWLTEFAKMPKIKERFQLLVKYLNKPYTQEVLDEYRKEVAYYAKKSINKWGEYT